MEWPAHLPLVRGGGVSRNVTFYIFCNIGILIFIYLNKNKNGNLNIGILIFIYLKKILFLKKRLDSA